MELQAAISALRAIGPDESVTIHSDSAYVVDGITKYIIKWRQNGFVTSQKTPVENRDLWEELDALAASRARFVKVAAHSGNRENERADEIAQSLARGRAVKLRDEDIIAPPAGAAPPPVHPPIPARLRYPAYIVWNGKTLAYYKTWDECSPAVSGKRGLRYKKCKTKEELIFTLENWGVRSIT